MPSVIDLSNQASDASDSEEEPLSHSATSRGAPDDPQASRNSSAPSSPSRHNRHAVPLYSRPRSLLDPAQAWNSSSGAAAAHAVNHAGNSSSFSSRGSTPGTNNNVPAQPRSFFRSTLSIPNGAGSSRQRYDPRPRDNEVIELSDDSEDDFEVTGGRAAPGQPSSSGRRVRGAPRARIDHTEFRRASEGESLDFPPVFADGSELDQVLQQRREAIQDLARVNNNERERVRERLDRELHSPPPPAPAPRIGLGGAVFRAGDRAVRFAPGRPTMRYRLRGEEPEEEHRERIQPLRAARLGGAFAPGAGNLGAAAAHETYIQGLGGLFGRAENIMNALLHPLNYMGGGPRAPPVQDIQTILAKVTPEKVPRARSGFTRTWDSDAMVEEEEKQRGIVLDETGDVVKQQIKPYLSCSACPEPLRLGSAARDDNDRIFALRCGHLLDGKCMAALAAGPSEDAAPPPKKRKTRSGNKNREHVFRCPVKGCEREHVSVLVNDEWGQKEGLGAVQVYV